MWRTRPKMTHSTNRSARRHSRASAGCCISQPARCHLCIQRLQLLSASPGSLRLGLCLCLLLSLVRLAAQQLSSLIAIPSPHRLRGAVVEGFGRGSKLLGCPTANLDPSSFRGLLTGAPRGVYMGWAQVGGAGQPVHKTVLSLGTNPTFADSREETVESYLLCDFPGDFYGQQIAIVIVAFMRPMEKYNGLGPLIKAIERDVRVGDRALDMEPYCSFKEDEWFKSGADSTASSNSNSNSSSA